MTYETTVITGDALMREISKVLTFEKRYALSDILRFLDNTDDHKVGILYGLRRTGKTTLLRQVLEELYRRGVLHSAALLYLSSGNNMNQVLRDMKRLMDEGKRYFLVDEITEVDGFVEGCALLSDYFSGCGVRVLLSGTSSLMFNFVTKQELYDRAVMFDTTLISYKEYKKLHASATVQYFVTRSGVALNPTSSPFAKEEDTLEYIDTAITKNIYYSLDRYRGGSHFFSLRELYARDLLVGVINKIVQNTGHSFTEKDIGKRFRSSDFGSAVEMLDKRDTSMRVPYRISAPTEAIEELQSQFLGVDKLTGNELFVTQNQLDSLREHLLSIDVITMCVHYEVGFKEPPRDHVIFTQPGLRYSIANAAQHAVHSEYPKSGLTQLDLTRTSKKMAGDVAGKLLENTLLLEATLFARKVWGEVSARRPLVSQLKFQSGSEIDIMLVNPTNMECTLIEVKNSSKRVPLEKTDDGKPYGQCRWLLDSNILQQVSEYVNPSKVKRILVYNGESAKRVIEDVDYVNAEEFLLNLGRYIYD